MEYLKTFESFEQINEEFSFYEAKKFVTNILTFPLQILAAALLQFVPSEFKKKSYLDLLDFYFNSEKILRALEISLNDINITDAKKGKIEYNIKIIKKMLRKYPTLADYKEAIKKRVFILDIRNMNYQKNQIDAYQPREFGYVDPAVKIQKICRDISSRDIRNAMAGPALNINQNLDNAVDPFGEDAPAPVNPREERRREGRNDLEQALNDVRRHAEQRRQRRNIRPGDPIEDDYDM